MPSTISRILLLTVGTFTFPACQDNPSAHDELGSTTGSDTDASTDSDGSTDETGTDTATDTANPACGDGILDPDEACDDGNFVDDDDCSNACALPACGDSIVQANEACDTGPNIGAGQLCNAMCQLNVCGDADPGPGESCDDGNAINDDACPNDCVLASCGNGIVDPGEECEDGNMDATDGCTNACLFPICGDGVVWSSHEACDDGNPSDNDDCTTLCEFATCGDGVLQGEEECEDGNTQPNDGCAGCLEQRVLAVAASSGTCALLDIGAVRCWGPSHIGQLGYGNTNNIGDNEYPYDAGDLDLGDGDVQALDSSEVHSCVLLDGGVMRCWGPNTFGELGYGNIDDIGDNEPAGNGGDVDVGGVVVQLAVGAVHTCALLDTGAVRCWGLGVSGTLGHGDEQWIGDDELPSSAGDIDVGGVVTRVSAGGSHTCALLDTGGLRCWGLGSLGALGYGNVENIGDDETPASAGDVDVGGVVVDMTLGYELTCALLDTGAVRCWGRNDHGQLGYGHTMNIGDDEHPATAGDVDLGAPATQISAEAYHVCAVLEGGTVRCWGQGMFGKLGYANELDIGDDESPASAGDVDVGGAVVSVSVGSQHTCALLLTGAVRCWGWNAYGQLGLRHTNKIGDDEAPASAGNVQVF